uniref:U44-Liphistoxin-Lsp1a_1 n=1 Tax=Liphistius sp. SGP-2016 TaxID=1905180 RepID=A0A4Q8K2H5_9ARAC
MKITLAFVMLSVMFVAGHAFAALTCIRDEERCGADECCLNIPPLIIKCKKLTEKGDRCEMKPMTNLIHKHVHMVKCPCAKGLKCVAKDKNFVGKFMGTCQDDSEEVVEPDT